MVKNLRKHLGAENWLYTAAHGRSRKSGLANRNRRFLMGNSSTNTVVFVDCCSIGFKAREPFLPPAYEHRNFADHRLRPPAPQDTSQ
jgi:hypothetical protein